MRVAGIAIAFGRCAGSVETKVMRLWHHVPLLIHIVIVGTTTIP